LVVGEDDSDEPLFAKANKLERPVFTAQIGKQRRSAAKTHVDDLAELMRILKRLSRHAIRDTRCYSTGDLRGLAASRAHPHRSFSLRSPMSHSFSMLFASDPPIPGVSGVIDAASAGGRSPSTAAPTVTLRSSPDLFLAKSESVPEYLNQFGLEEEEPLSF
jgi:hypothetical protein